MWFNDLCSDSMSAAREALKKHRHLLFRIETGRHHLSGTLCCLDCMDAPNMDVLTFKGQQEREY
ncbi:MAG: hypothetical protein AUJ57_05490 [Zetaproteobacteria bacterium CG1_02_53_45]|nr:MAG: hypothetical protein AUJ57_05490 [Zetaproteobacteria bacterium CG1_02_53_45]